MVNYSSIIDILQSDKYVDKTYLFDSFFCRNYQTLGNCYRTGSSLFLKTLACFLDETADTKDVFKRLRIGQHECFAHEANAYRVLYLDFSDFKAKDFAEAINYITIKMSQAFKHYWDILSDGDNRYYDYHTLEKVLDIMEQEPAESTLQDALRILMLQLRGYETNRNGKKLAVLIDNMVKMETVAHENGYSAQMENFLKRFIVNDVYKFCDIFLQISDMIDEDDSYYPTKRHIVHQYFTVFTVDLRERYPELAVPEASQYGFPCVPFVPVIAGWHSIIDKGRKEIRMKKEEEELARLERIRKRKERYAIELSPAIPRFSPNMGLREKKVDKSSDEYKNLNNILKRLYAQCYPEFKKQHVYANLQNLDWSRKIVRDVERLKSDIEKLSKLTPHWKEVWVNGSLGTWLQVVCRRVDDKSNCSPARPENIKVYASLKSGNAEKTFLESMKFLMDNVKNSFAAKVSVYYRSDQICYWIAPDDFHCLEDFYAPHYDDLETAMPFMAYMGRLGISKDFPGTDNSHNSMQADIIADYFRSVKDIEKLDIEDMYNNYILKWNDETEEEGETLGFMDSSALSFVVILDTLDAILGRKPIDDKSFLIADDGIIWRILAESLCWDDVNTRLQKPRYDKHYSKHLE